MTGGQQGYEVIHTSNMGGTWQSYPAPNNGWLYTVNNKLFLIGHQASTVYSNDHGATWSSDFPGIPQHPVIWTNIANNQMCSIISHSNDLYCTPYYINSQNAWQGGVYKLASGDTAWKPFYTGIEDFLDNSGYYGIPQRLFSFKEKLYLTIGNRGIWTHALQGNVVTFSEEKKGPENKNSFVFPNPSPNTVNIHCSEPSLVKVCDVSGRKIFEKSMNEGYGTLTIPDCSEGVYLFQIITKEKTDNIKVLIKE
jgi:hypothetical protein